MRAKLPFALAIVTVTAGAAVLAAAIDVLPAAEPGGGQAYLSPVAQASDTPSQTPEAPKEVPKQATPEAAVPTGTPAAVLGGQDVDNVLGKPVRGNAGENMGHIVDVLVSRGGRVCGVVIDFGGFLGVGNRKIAVDWGSLHFNKPDKSGQVTVDLSTDQLRSAPEYKSGEPVVILGAASPTGAPGAPSPAQDK